MGHLIRDGDMAMQGSHCLLVFHYSELLAGLRLVLSAWMSHHTYGVYFQSGMNERGELWIFYIQNMSRSTVRKKWNQAIPLEKYESIHQYPGELCVKEWRVRIPLSISLICETQIDLVVWIDGKVRLIRAHVNNWHLTVYLPLTSYSFYSS